MPCIDGKISAVFRIIIIGLVLFSCSTRRSVGNLECSAESEGPGLMVGHSGGITGFTSVVAYVAEDDLYVSVLFNEKSVAAEAGLWALVKAVRGYRNR